MIDHKDPNWRGQYDRSVKPDPEVEAALSGSSNPVTFRPAPQPFPMTPSQFGQFVKLR